MNLPDSTSWVSIPGLEGTLSDVDSVYGDGVFDSGQRKTINKSIKCQLLPVSDVVGFTAVMALGAFWVLTTKPFLSVEINKKFQ